MFQGLLICRARLLALAASEVRVAEAVFGVCRIGIYICDESEHADAFTKAMLADHAVTKRNHCPVVNHAIAPLIATKANKDLNDGPEDFIVQLFVQLRRSMRRWN